MNGYFIFVSGLNMNHPSWKYSDIITQNQINYSSITVFKDACIFCAHSDL